MLFDYNAIKLEIHIIQPTIFENSKIVLKNK